MRNFWIPFYAPNQGDPLTVAKKALIAMREKYASHGVRLEILAAGTTGYGEMLFSRAFSAETHAVETGGIMRVRRQNTRRMRRFFWTSVVRI